MHICSIIGARNEAHYFPYLIPYLTSQDIDVVIIDHASTDDTLPIARSFLGRGVLDIVHLPFNGFFALREQLRKKQEIAKALDHDWIIHHDADEIFEDVRPGKCLREALEEADQEGYNVINFDEFTFVPMSGQSYKGRDYRQEMRHYYFFEPSPLRLMRAWKRSLRASNIDDGGHHLIGEAMRICPLHHGMRHYLGLSESHLRRKYLNRSYAPDEIENGWHDNRVIISESNLVVPNENELFMLPSARSKDFNKSSPRKTHFWEW